MKQLDLRFYSRSELSEILNVRLENNSHFARDVKTTLINWGYSFEYSRKGATITRQPQTEEERLSEIMIRKYDIDIQVDTYAFACFIVSFFEIEAFGSMPWEERAKNLIEIYGIETGGTVKSFARTLKKWSSKLIKTGTMTKSEQRTHWRTTIFEGKKFRDWVDGDKEMEIEMKKYMKRRSDLLTNFIRENIEKGLDYKAANNKAWKDANEVLWNTFHCCYYSCKTFILSAFDDMEELEEVYQLINSIAANAASITKVEVFITSGIEQQDDNAVAQLIEKGYLVNTNGLKYNFNEIPDVSKRYNEEANFSDVSKRYNRMYPKDTRNITTTTNITNNITEESSISTSYEVEKLSVEVEPEAVETSSKEEALTEVSYSQAVSIWGDEFIINGNILTFKEGTLNYGKKYRIIGG